MSAARIKWSKEQERLLFQLAAGKNVNWDLVGDEFPQFSVEQLKNRYFYLLRLQRRQSSGKEPNGQFSASAMQSADDFVEQLLEHLRNCEDKADE